MSGLKKSEELSGELNAKEINLKDWFHVLRSRFWIIAGFVLLFTAVGAYFHTQPITPLYKADTRIIVKSNSEKMETIIGFIKEPIVIERVISDLSLQRSRQALRNQINVESSANSQIFNISVVDLDPIMAAQIANAMVVAYKHTLSEFIGWSDIRVISEANAQDSQFPINSKSNRLLILSFFGGLFFGVAAAFLRQSLDDTIHSKQEIERILGYPVLGNVSKIKKRDVTVTQKSRDLSVSLRGETIGS